MACSTVDNGVVGEVLAIVDQNAPEVDEDEEEDICSLLEREDEGENVVGHRLGETIQRVESMAGVRSGHDPLVVRLVQVLVDEWVVKVAVNPVDTEVGKEQEERELEDIVPHPGAFVGGVVKLAVATNLKAHERSGAESHEWHRLVGLNDFEPYLVLDELGMVESTLIKDELEG